MWEWAGALAAKTAGSLVGKAAYEKQVKPLVVKADDLSDELTKAYEVAFKAFAEKRGSNSSVNYHGSHQTHSIPMKPWRYSFA